MILLVIIGILGFVALYDTLALPATDWDSLTYGVNYAKIMFNVGNIPLIAGPSIGIEMSASYPPGVQLIGVFLYVFAGNVNDFYYRMLSPIFSLSTLLVTYKFAMLLNKNRTFSIYAISTLSIIPFFWELFINETYLMALTLMLTLAAFFFYNAYIANPSDSKKYEVIGTLFCGFAALTSYIGLFSFGILLLYAAIKKSNLKRIIWLFALALVIVMPWYTRNVVLLGNPVYPFFGIGKYLDPLLRSSTAQHFQHYLLIPFYGWLSALCKLGAVFFIGAIGYLTFSKRKNFLMVIPLYFLLICALIMVFHVAFPRYVIVALPVLVVIFSAIIKTISKSRKLSIVISVALISFIVVSSALILPYVNTVKPQSQPGDNKWQYLSRVYEEADAWQWINENTPLNARIATFDIKLYYLNRDVLPLDGNESVPLYQITTIQESLKFLQDRGVSYVLSVPWASPTDNRMPSAYSWCPFIKYLGDPNFLPPLFVGRNGTAVYHVGPLNEETISQVFAVKDMVPPLKKIIVNVTITNNTYPYFGEFYLPIPVDYRGGTITASANSSKPIEVELWNELATTEKIENPSVNFMIAKSQFDNSSGVGNFTLKWLIDRAGYFTIRIVDKKEILDYAFNVTLNLTFHNYWETETG
jgi:hypothetical protein